METDAIVIYATAAAASFAAMVAAAFDRFHNALATSAVLIAGMTPWPFFLLWANLIPHSRPLFVASLLGTGPMFLIACFLYGYGKQTARSKFAGGASLLGMFAGVGFTFVLSDLLSRMP